MIYFYYGTDAYRVAEALRESIENARKVFGAGAATAPFRIQPDDEEPERIFSYLAAASLFEPYKIAAVEKVGGFSKIFRDELLAHVKKAAVADDKNVLLFVTHVVVEEKKKAVGREDAVAGAFAKAASKAERFDALAGSALFKWVERMCAARGIEMTRGATEALIALHGAESAALAGEIEKLALYLDASPASPKKAGERELRQLGKERIEEDAFKIIDALGARKAADAMRILLRIFARGEDPLKFLGLLTYAVRAMVAVKDAGSRPLRPEDIPATTGLADWQTRQYRRATEKFSLDELKKLYERLLTVDYKTKTGEGNPRTLLERFVLSV